MTSPTSPTSTTPTSSWAVTPGEWYAVLGETTAVLLPPSSRERAPAIWEKVDEGAGFDEVLDALISRGLRQLPAFVLASAEGGDVKVVVRGEGEVELDTRAGPETVLGSHDTTWVERNVTGVTRIRIRVAPGDGAPYPVAGGLVRVCEVERPPRANQTPAPPERPQSRHRHRNRYRNRYRNHCRSRHRSRSSPRNHSTAPRSASSPRCPQS